MVSRGYLFIGADDKTGEIKGIKITDQFLQNLAGHRDSGQIVPLPSLTVQLKYKIQADSMELQPIFPIKMIIEIQTSMFLEEERLEELWPEEGDHKSILLCISPILEGTGDITTAHTERILDNLHLISGDLGLSQFEDKLSDSCPVPGSRPRGISCHHCFLSHRLHCCRGYGCGNRAD